MCMCLQSATFSFYLCFFFWAAKKKQNQTNTRKKQQQQKKDIIKEEESHCDVGLWRRALTAFQQGELLSFFFFSLAFSKKVAVFLCRVVIMQHIYQRVLSRRIRAYCCNVASTALFFFCPPLPLFLSPFFSSICVIIVTQSNKERRKEGKKRFVVCRFVQDLW